jgi:hypothetical protein
VFNSKEPFDEVQFDDRGTCLYPVDEPMSQQNSVRVLSNEPIVRFTFRLADPLVLKRSSVDEAGQS